MKRLSSQRGAVWGTRLAAVCVLFSPLTVAAQTPRPGGTEPAKAPEKPEARAPGAGNPEAGKPEARKPVPRLDPARAARAAARAAVRPVKAGITYRRLFPVPLPARNKAYVERTAEDRQLLAEKYFKMGNRQFEQRELDKAIRLYEQAYKVWPHPRILYNIAINLGYLSNPLESARKFRKVLQYEPGPIQPRRYQEAASLYRRLMRRLGTIRVTCNQANARVFVDGILLGVAPLDKTITVMPGRHLVSAKKQGKVPYAKEVKLQMGYLATVGVVLSDFADVIRYKTVARYKWYWPVAATAAAVVALSVGAGLWVSGRNDIQDLRSQISANFTSIKGPITYPTGTEKRAVTVQQTGQGMIGVGMAAAAASVVLWLLRTKRVKYTVEGAPGGAGVKVNF